MEALKIVIIENEKAHFSLMKRAIDKSFPHVSITHFQEAGAFLEKIDEIAPDVIITDYIMPDMNGIELLEILSSDGSDIPVIMITAHGDETVAVRAMKLGVWDYLVKSEDVIDMLPDVISNVIRERNLKESLRESEEILRSMFETSPIGIAAFDSKAQLIKINSSCLDMFGISKLADVKGANLFDDPNMPKNAKEKIHTNKTVKYKTAYNFEQIKKCKLYATTKSGIDYIDVLITKIGFNNEDSLNGYLMQIINITKRARAESRIIELSQRLMRTQEIERQKLSCDLHDNLAQDLSTLKISLDTLFEGQPDVPDEIREKVSGLSEIVHKSIMDVREMAYNLRPSGLNRLGLVKSLLMYCKDFSEKHKIKIDFFSAGMDGLTLGFDLKINIYRLIQEGLNNVKKHADADHAIVRLVGSFPNIILRIEDNGKGFDVQKRMVEAISEKRRGLYGMEQRVAFLRGFMKIESKPMLGTKIIIEIPAGENKTGENKT